MLFIIKAFAESGTPTTAKGKMNKLTGVSRRKNPMTRFYEQGGQSALGATAKTRGKAATIRAVGR